MLKMRVLGLRVRLFTVQSETTDVFISSCLPYVFTWPGEQPKLPQEMRFVQHCCHQNLKKSKITDIVVFDRAFLKFGSY